MHSTLSETVPPYIGADLTDRYSRACRPVDVCGLTPDKNGRLKISFWKWNWDAEPKTLDVKKIAKELNSSRAAMLDGPQGLAMQGCAMRACERLVAAAGKTPDKPPSLDRTFAGYIRSSLDLFAALKNNGIKISPMNFIEGVSEVYPGHIWRTLSNRALPKKSCYEGRKARKHILEVLGVTALSALPTHDENDACVAALMAAAADKRVRGLTVSGIGKPLIVESNGTLREGQMIIPVLTTEMLKEISEVLNDLLSIKDAVCKADALQGDTSRRRAEELLNTLIDSAQNGNPQICTYSYAYKEIFRASYKKWSQAYVEQVLRIARETSLRALADFAVRLDAFIVNRRNKVPGEGHWKTANYDQEQWERVLGMAELLY